MEPRIEPHSGFGRREVVAGYVVRPRTAEEAADVFRRGERVALRGAGRSYGDAAIHREGLVLDLTAMDRVLAVDPCAATIEVEGGATIAAICRAGLDHGLWPYVVTGTARPTIGGAIAMNVHGKNALRRGTLGEHLLEFDLLTPGGELRTLLPEDPEFALVLGSAGTLGVVTRAKMRLCPVVSGLVRATARRAADWDALFDRFETARGTAEYMVGSVDTFATGESAGRGLFESAEFADDPDPASLTPGTQSLPAIEDERARLLIRDHGWRALSLAMHPRVMAILLRRMALRGRERTWDRPLSQFNFQLDALPGWERAYGPAGFIQYQSFVPAIHARAVFAAQTELLQRSGIPAYLPVFKAHRADGFPLSPSLDGYSLALDLPIGRASWPEIQRACWAMNDLVLAHGGRFYLAKDSTLRPEDARTYLGPALDGLRALKSRWDPKALLTSDLAARLELFD